MEIGRAYKVVYKDGEYTKILNAILKGSDDTFLFFENTRDGKTYINKTHIIKLQEVSANDVE